MTGNSFPLFPSQEIMREKEIKSERERERERERKIENSAMPMDWSDKPNKDQTL